MKFNPTRSFNDFGRPATRFALLVSALVLARPVQAQPVPTEPERLFEEGRAAMQAGDYSSACQKFADSNRLEPAIGTRFNLARCEEEAGHVLAAWTLFRQVRSELPAGDRRVSVADQHVDALAGRIGHLRILLDPGTPGAGIRIDDIPADGPEVTGTFPIEPGKHRVSVAVPGRAEETRVLDFAEGSTIELRLPSGGTLPSARPRDSVGSENPRSGAPDSAESSEPQRTAAYLVGGAGVVALLAGTVAGIAGLHQEGVGNTNCSDATRTCNQKGVDANRSAHSLATISTIGLAVGVVGLGLGGYFYFSAKRPSPSTSGQGRSTALSVAWGGRW